MCKNGMSDLSDVSLASPEDVMTWAGVKKYFKVDSFVVVCKETTCFYFEPVRNDKGKIVSYAVMLSSSTETLDKFLMNGKD